MPSGFGLSSGEEKRKHLGEAAVRSGPPFPMPLSALLRHRAVVIWSLLLVGPLLLAALLYWLEDWRGHREWAEYEAAARRRGLRLTMREFAPPPVPDELNFAATPLFQDAFAAEEGGRDPVAALTFPRTSSEFPRVGEVFAGRHTDLAAWRDYFLKSKLLPASTGDSARDVLVALERYRPALDQLREAAARPASRFPVPWEHGAGFAFPHWAILNRLSFMLMLHAEAELASDHPEEAAADLNLILRCHQALKREPLMVNAMMRYLLLSRFVDVIWEGVTRRAWRVEDLRAWRAELHRLDLIGDYKFAMSSERGAMNDFLDRYEKQPQPLLGFLDGHAWGRSDSVIAGTLMPMVVAATPPGWVLRNKAAANRIFDATIEAIPAGARTFPRQSSFPARLEELKSRGAAAEFYFSPVLFSVEGLGPLEGKVALVMTATQEAEIACALAEREAAGQGLPAGLEELVPEWLSEVPRDIVDGAPLRYHRDGPEAYRLWSVGKDGLDQGGLFPRDGQPSQDWVWEVAKPQ